MRVGVESFFGDENKDLKIKCNEIKRDVELLGLRPEPVNLQNQNPCPVCVCVNMFYSCCGDMYMFTHTHCSDSTYFWGQNAKPQHKTSNLG